MYSHNALFIGNDSRSEFCFSKHEIQSSLLRSHWNIVSSNRISSTYFNFNPPELVVLFQSYPSEFSPALLRNLHQLNPVAPTLLIAGACSEGQERTHQPSTVKLKLYATQWNFFYSRELQAFLRQQPSIFSSSYLLENDEFALYQTTCGNPENESDCFSRPAQQPDSFAVSRFGPLGNDPDMNQMLLDFHQKHDHYTPLNRKQIDASFNGLLLADADDSPFPQILKAVQRLRRQFADAKIRVCINSPRINERIELLKTGIDEILPKPVFW